MIRGLNALAGMILFGLGLTVTFITLTADGWTVLAGIGLGMLVIDLVIEDRQASEHANEAGA